MSEAKLNILIKECTRAISFGRMTGFLLCPHFILLFSILSVCNGQLPSSSLYLFDIDLVDQSVKFSNPVYLTAFNAEGYNNQPSFSSESEFFFTSDADTPGQTDIFYANLSIGVLRNITNSTESAEYSPYLNTERDQLMMVWVDSHGGQFLVGMDWPEQSKMSVILPDLDNVGYYLEFSPDTLIAFLVNDPVELWTFPISGKTRRGLTQNNGRCFTKLNNSEILYIHKVSSEKWTLRSMNILDGSSQYFADMPKGVEDFVVLDQNLILCASNSKIYALDNNSSIFSKWKELIDLSFLPIKNITRMAVNKSFSKIILVGN